MKLEDAVKNVPEYTWPDECIVQINKSKMLEFIALQLYSSVKKRKDCSFFITERLYRDRRLLK